MTFENQVVYNFDDIGVPGKADTVWRGLSTDKWLQKLLTETRDVIVVDGVVFGGIVAYPHAKELKQILEL